MNHLGQSNAHNTGAAWEAYSTQARQAISSGRYADAERLFASALRIAEKFGEEDGRLFATLKATANFYENRGEHAVALVLYRRALAIGRKTLGENVTEIRDLESVCILLEHRVPGGSFYV